MYPNLFPARELRLLFDAAIRAAQPGLCLPPHLPSPDEVQGRLIVIGAGKAAAAMAQAVEQHWQGRRVSGLVVTRYGYHVPCQHIAVIEAGHPVPDKAGLLAAQRMLNLVKNLSAYDVVLCLISGGGSALLPLPLPGLTLADKQSVHRALLASGATISEMNTVRRHLSAIKGGRLAAACHPARVITLLLSDVPGDHPLDIASGPTVADPTSCADALAVTARYSLRVPEAVLQVLRSGQGETIKPGDARLARSETRMIATPQLSLNAAAQVAKQQGYTPHILSDAMEGEAREVGKVLAAIALQTAQRAEPFAPHCVLLSGGETTVSLNPHAAAGESGATPAHAQGPYRGGRNVECLLSFTLATQGHARIHALMGDTDGVDGSEDIAGATMAPDSLSKAAALGLQAKQYLDRHDAHSFFETLGDSVITGPTLTNVNDFRAILVTH